MKQKQRLVLGLMLLIVAASVAVACGVGNMVRPNDIRANQAIGEDFQCTPDTLAGSLSPFTVDWSDGDRIALESEMADGVALVKFTCEGVKVLRGCEVPGNYGYKGLSKKTKLVTMNDMASVKANIGGTVNMPSEFKAEMSQGSALNLAYVLVGAENTTVKNVSRALIRNAQCKEATHFVYEAQVGAFAMETSAQGEVKAAADVLGFGSVKGQASSEKKVRVTDGEPQACDRTSSKDREKTDGCQALMRVSLIPLTDDRKQEGGTINADIGTSLTTVDARGCPSGFVYNDGQCKRPTEAKASLCDEGDLKGCRKQCEAGSVESCGRFSSAFMDETMGAAAYINGEAAAKRFLAEVLPLKAKLQDACDNLEASACALAALALDEKAIKSEDDPGPKYIQEFVSMMSMGCMLGDQRACGVVADAYGDGMFSGLRADADMLDIVLGSACEGGNTRACWLIGEIYYFNVGGIKRDVSKMGQYLSRACFGDHTLACAFVGLAYETRDVAACKKNVNDTKDFFGDKSFILRKTSDDDDITEFCQATSSLYSVDISMDAFFSACDNGGPFADKLCSSAIRDLNLDFDFEFELE